VQVEQSFEVQYPAALVWRSFHDTEGIVGCLPGASLTAPPVDGDLKLAMTVKLGPIVAAFAGEARMNLDDAAHSGSVAGGGSDRKSGSRVKGEAKFSLHELAQAQPATRVDVVVDFTITGALAQFSRGGIVQELATRLTEAFAANLRAKLEAESQQGTAAPAAVAASTQAVADPSPAAAAVSAASVAQTAPMSHAAEAAPAAPAAQTQAGQARPAAPAAGAPQAAAPRNAAPLDLGSLFWPMLLSRLRRLFGFGK
jgi:carbon monoxide dehydrogenase subunit G